MMRLSRYGGNQNLGVFAITNDEFSFIAADASPEFIKDVEDALGVTTELVTMAGSFVIGSLVAMNSSGAVVSGLADQAEIDAVAKKLSVAKLHDKLNAAGNNILTNDFGAIINPEVSDRSLKEISDALGVECVRSALAGCNTVGSVAKVTQKGCIIGPDATDADIALIKDVLKVEAVRTTVNHGIRYVGAGVLANSKGALIGDDTTPIEMGKIEDGLVLY